MNRTITIAPVRKSMVVEASQAMAFDVFTAGIDRWWPKAQHIAEAPVKASIFEPFVGGRWYVTCEDGSEATVGHVRVWQPPERFVVGWEINARWKPEARVELASEVEVRFVAQGAACTRVELEHRNFERMGATDGESMRNNVDRGWPGILALFAKTVANGTN